MITTLDRISEFEASVATVVTDMSVWSRERLIQEMDEARAVGISNTMQGGTVIHPSWQQNLTIPYNEEYQSSDCFTTFPFPYSVIKATKTQDGCIFVGNDNFTASYGRVNTRGQLLNLQKHRILIRTITNGVAALLEDGNWLVYSDLTQGRIQSLGVIAIFNSPTKLPYFNLAKDDYPVDNTVFDFMLGYAKEKYLNQQESTPVTTQRTNKNVSQFSIPQRRR